MVEFEKAQQSFFNYLFVGLLTISLPVSHAEDLNLTEFSKNVTFHVLFHELGHALINEFDLPILANEEAMADSFSTIWINKIMRDRAASIVMARTQSWLYEDSLVHPNSYDFKGEHLLDIRRAYQVACLFYGLDPAEYSRYVKPLKFSIDDLADCSDTAPDQEQSWLNLLTPHRLSSEDLSANIELIYGEGPMKETMQLSGMLEIFLADIRLFNWPRGITVHFDHCDRGAFWSSNDRTITLCDDYVHRFVEQGIILNFK